MSMFVDMDTTFVENARMTKRLHDNSTEVRQYRIYPNEGYVLHDRECDEIVMDEDGNETGERRPGFVRYPAFASCGGTYDFHGENPREFYCVPQDSVDEDQINK